MNTKNGFVFLPWQIFIGVAALGSAVAYQQRDSLPPAVRQFIPQPTSPSPTPFPTPSTLTFPDLSSALSAPYALECKPSADSQLKDNLVYVDPANSLLRIDSTNTGARSHLIMREGAFWSWVDSATYGDTLPTTSLQPNPLTVVTNLVCQPWALDPTFFTLPSNVDFTPSQARIDKAWEAKRQLDARIKEINDSLLNQ